MIEILMAYEPWTRLAAFAGVFVVMALWELRRFSFRSSRR